MARINPATGEHQSMVFEPGDDAVDSEGKSLVGQPKGMEQVLRERVKTPAREVLAGIGRDRLARSVSTGIRHQNARVTNDSLRAPRAARLCDDSVAELVSPRTTAPPGPNHSDNGSHQSTTRPCRRRSSSEYPGAKKLKLIPIDGIGRAISSEGNFIELQSVHRIPSPGPTLLTSRPPSSIVRLPVLQVRLRLAYGNDMKRYGWGGEWNEVRQAGSRDSAGEERRQWCEVGER
ncbi:hypothetical protein B0H11DRAFT_2203786 [Mycena galericulata]|nr:hypothetical protein B0H11DRAFT_2203786 [Mycena galericulata]